MTDIREWLDESRHLPKFLRDFHEQKAIFKRIHGLLREKEQKSDVPRLDITWIDAHIYTIDKFLWHMALRGYTLQKNRNKNVDFLEPEWDEE